MENEKLISHTIHIAGESYPVRLTEMEKPIAIEVEADINKKIAEFKVKYMVKTTKDILAMILLTYAFEAKKNSQSGKQLNVANDKVERLLDIISREIQ